MEEKEAMIKKINNKGYTLIEILVASGIFAMMMTMVTSVSIDFYKTQKKERMLNGAYEEGRFIMERIVGHFRGSNTIDYEEYYCHHLTRFPSGNDYGGCPQGYEEKFHHQGDLSKKNEGCFDASTNPNTCGDSALIQEDQDELYLISQDGKTKTIFKRVGNKVNDDGLLTADDGAEGDSGKEVLVVGKMVVADTDDDNKFDSWVPHPDYLVSGTGVDATVCANLNNDVSDHNYYIWLGGVGECFKLFSITPPDLEIRSLDFFVSPLEDPRKAFKEQSSSIQNQPHVSILMEISMNRAKDRMMKGENNILIMQTSISSRVYNDVVFPQ